MQENNTGIKSHNFIMENRGRVMLTGVREVDSFNEHEVVVFTELGELRIKGRELLISRVNTDTGELEMTGSIDSTQYGSHTERVPDNFITRLFK